MMNDSQVDWQSLGETYSKMWDDELLELAAGSADLTEVAREVLRSEIKKRGLDKPSAGSDAPTALGRPPSAQDLESGGGLADGEEPEEENAAPSEFTWKTMLCECEDYTQAWQLREALRQAGVESWIEGTGSHSPFSSLGGGNLRVTVAADQLDLAREIAERPICQEIVDQSTMEVPEFEAPVCPDCGADDPLLESVEPFNTWLCESCGREWSESAADVEGNLGESER